MRAVKYHPRGSRGLADGTRPAEYGIGLSQADYIEAANRETLVCVQMEDEAAVHNADEILAVDDVDVFFIGPSDLSQSMGYPGNPKAPAVAEAIDVTIDMILGAGEDACRIRRRRHASTSNSKPRTGCLVRVRDLPPLRAGSAHHPHGGRGT